MEPGAPNCLRREVSKGSGFEPLLWIEGFRQDLCDPRRRRLHRDQIPRERRFLGPEQKAAMSPVWGGCGLGLCRDRHFRPEPYSREAIGPVLLEDGVAEGIAAHLVRDRSCSRRIGCARIRWVISQPSNTLLSHFPPPTPPPHVALHGAHAAPLGLPASCLYPRVWGCAA